jgi:hypothetical protein
MRRTETSETALLLLRCAAAMLHRMVLLLLLLLLQPPAIERAEAGRRERRGSQGRKARLLAWRPLTPPPKHSAGGALQRGWWARLRLACAMHSRMLQAATTPLLSLCAHHVLACCCAL